MKFILTTLAAVAAILTTEVSLKNAGATSLERQLLLSRESLSDYAALKSYSARSRVQCTAAASRDTAVQLVAFNASSGLCTHYGCRLGLSHCRKCRNVGIGDQLVWAFSTGCWTTVQHRVSGSVDFYRNWSQYQIGFGEGADGNYWIGLNWLHAFTATGSRKLRFLMKAWNGSEHWAEYSSFQVAALPVNYRLQVSGFSGSSGIGDSLASHSGLAFSTFDADHDTSNGNCAKYYVGAWWFGKCSDAHPNGKYLAMSQAVNNPDGQGITWYYYFGFQSLKEIEMLVL